MVAGSPWDIYRTPKDVTRNKRKPLTIEEDIVEEVSEGRDSVKENIRVAAEECAATSQSQRIEDEMKDAEDQAPERRTKKRHDRPSSADENQAPAKPPKRVKTRANKPKGMSSKSNTNSIPIAQEPPSQNQPPPISKTQPIPEANFDSTKPITMILPNSTTQTCLLSSNSSSSSSTSNSSSSTKLELDSEYIERLLKKPLHKRKRKPKTKPNSKSLSEPLNLTKEYATVGCSFLNHLESHTSGDAFTSSALNSPNLPLISL
jgi:hypothetical protein